MNVDLSLRKYIVVELCSFFNKLCEFINGCIILLRLCLDKNRNLRRISNF